MKTGSTLRQALPALRAAAMAAAMACSAGASSAADATLSITSFSASAEAFSGFYVYATEAHQSFSMSAANGDGATASDSYSANDWYQGDNRLAQTSQARATGNTVQFTDAFTQLGTAGFNLGASALEDGLANKATASGSQSGGFSLINGNGDAVAGSITFDIYYDMAVSPPAGSSPANDAQTVFSLLTSSTAGTGPSFSDGLLSSTPAQWHWRRLGPFLMDGQPERRRLGVLHAERQRHCCRDAGARTRQLRAAGPGPGRHHRMGAPPPGLMTAP
jgi:hypothetical protein